MAGGVEGWMQFEEQRRRRKLRRLARRRVRRLYRETGGEVLLDEQSVYASLDRDPYADSEQLLDQDDPPDEDE